MEYNCECVQPCPNGESTTRTVTTCASVHADPVANAELYCLYSSDGSTPECSGACDCDNCTNTGEWCEAADCR